MIETYSAGLRRRGNRVQTGSTRFTLRVTGEAELDGEGEGVTGVVLDRGGGAYDATFTLNRAGPYTISVRPRKKQNLRGARLRAPAASSAVGAGGPALTPRNPSRKFCNPGVPIVVHASLGHLQAIRPFARCTELLSRES